MAAAAHLERSKNREARDKKKKRQTNKSPPTTANNNPESPPEQVETGSTRNAYQPTSSVVRSFLYKPFMLLPDLTEFTGKLIEIRVHKVYLTKFNRAFQYRMFYSSGNDSYSSDSDIACILQHQGKVSMSDVEPDFEGLSVYFKVTRSNRNFH